uniref:Lung adenoma susceptibility protein 2 n=1 Tax=Petromyzon marinus TaxID=7757 RepID=A0AAJ7TUN5_PETMA|nr:lung adenoma susceptibility protein 2 [Petromyzon marinus]XP_032824443.1 lung adenoma susceptibility protein 2 [Petromyzon marinus]
MAERRRAEERRMRSVDEGGTLLVEDLISGTCSLNATLRCSGRGSEPDGQSLTTDQLLAAPADGSSMSLLRSHRNKRSSLGVTAHSLGASLVRGNKPTERLTSTSRSNKALTPLSLSAKPKKTLFSNQKNVLSYLRSSEETRRERLPSGGGGCATSTYPRWLTSQKDELDVSGITSIPELRYPAWLRDCDVDSQTSSHETDTSTKRAGATQNPQSRPKYPEWLKDLDISGLTNVANKEPVSEDLRSLARSHERHIKALVSDAVAEAFGLAEDASTVDDEGELTVRSVRENPALLELFQANSAQNSKPLTETASLEELLSRARMALDSSGLEAPSPGSVNTDIFLGADRPWENPSTPFKLPVHVHYADDPGEEGLASAATSSDSKSMKVETTGLTRRLHPGPVEALKQMLFRLQSVQLGTPAEDTGSAGTQIMDEAASQVDLPEFESVPGGMSLQRALYHLSRLKELVDTIKKNKDG